MNSPAGGVQRRNRSFEDSHREMIETAVRLIGEKGVEALSIADLAREIGINRTTVYYHFDSREALIAEVKAWSSAQLARAYEQDRSRPERMEHIYRFVLTNPELLKMWIDDFISGGDIRVLYPHWDELVEGMRDHFREAGIDGDPEVFCVNLLTSAFIGPRVFRNSICADADDAEVIERFRRESLRTLRSLSLV